MAEQTRATIKANFETGDKPTETQFGDAWDSYVNLLDDGALVGGEDAMTAFSGGGQGSATQITKKVNRFTTVAAPADSAKLPVAVPGMSVYVENSGVSAMDLYPAVGGVIAGLGVNNPQSVPAGVTIILASSVAGGWSIYNTF